MVLSADNLSTALSLELPLSAITGNLRASASLVGANIADATVAVTVEPRAFALAFNIADVTITAGEPLELEVSIQPQDAQSTLLASERVVVNFEHNGVPVVPMIEVVLSADNLSTALSLELPLSAITGNLRASASLVGANIADATAAVTVERRELSLSFSEPTVNVASSGSTEVRLSLEGASLVAGEQVTVTLINLPTGVTASPNPVVFDVDQLSREISLFAAANAMSGILTASAEEIVGANITDATVAVTIEQREFRLVFDQSRVEIRGGNSTKVNVSLMSPNGARLTDSERVTVEITTDGEGLLNPPTMVHLTRDQMSTEIVLLSSSTINGNLGRDVVTVNLSLSTVMEDITIDRQSNLAVDIIQREFVVSFSPSSTIVVNRGGITTIRVSLNGIDGSRLFDDESVLISTGFVETVSEGLVFPFLDVLSGVIVIRSSNLGPIIGGSPLALSSSRLEETLFAEVSLDIPAGQYRIPYNFRKGDTNASSFDIMEDSVHPAPRMVEVLASQFTLSFSPPAVTATAGVAGALMNLRIGRLDSSEEKIVLQRSGPLARALRATFRYEDGGVYPSDTFDFDSQGVIREGILTGLRSRRFVDLLYRLNLPADAQSGTLTATVDVAGAPEDFLPIVAAATLPVTIELRAFALEFNPQRVQVRGGNSVSVTVSLEPAMRTTLAESEIVTVVMTADQEGLLNLPTTVTFAANQMSTEIVLLSSSTINGSLEMDVVTVNVSSSAMMEDITIDRQSNLAVDIIQREFVVSFSPSSTIVVNRGGITTIRVSLNGIDGSRLFDDESVLISTGFVETVSEGLVFPFLDVLSGVIVIRSSNLGPIIGGSPLALSSSRLEETLFAEVSLDIPAGQYRIPYNFRKGDTNASSFDIMEDSVHPAPRMVEVLASQFTLSFSPPAVTATAGVAGALMNLRIGRLDSSEEKIVLQRSGPLARALRATFRYEDGGVYPSDTFDFDSQGVIREGILTGLKSRRFVDLLYRLNLPVDAQSGTLTATVDVEGAPEDFLPIVAAATLPVTVEPRAFALAFNVADVTITAGEPLELEVSIQPQNAQSILLPSERVVVNFEHNGVPVVPMIEVVLSADNLSTALSLELPLSAITGNLRASAEEIVGANITDATVAVTVEPRALSLSFSEPTVNVATGGSTEVRLSLEGASLVADEQVTVTLINLPTGVTASPNPLVFDVDQLSREISLLATVNAMAGTLTASAEEIAGANIESADLAVTVSPRAFALVFNIADVTITAGELIELEISIQALDRQSTLQASERVVVNLMHNEITLASMPTVVLSADNLSTALSLELPIDAMSGNLLASASLVGANIADGSVAVTIEPRAFSLVFRSVKRYRWDR